MTTLRYKLFAFGLLLSLATVVGAYTPPAGAFPSNNTDVPLNVTNVMQDKSGGLSVGALHVRGLAYFADQTFVPGRIRGGNVGDVAGTVAFGGLLNNVNALINGTVNITGTAQSDSLAFSSQSSVPDLAPVCANQYGTFFICSNASSTPPIAPGVKKFYSVNGGKYSQPASVITPRSPQNGEEGVPATNSRYHFYNIRFSTTNPIQDDVGTSLKLPLAINSAAQDSAPNDNTIYESFIAGNYHTVSPQKVLTITQSGSYNIKFSAKGYIDFGFYSDERLWRFLNFYAKVGDQIYPLKPKYDQNPDIHPQIAQKWEHPRDGIERGTYTGTAGFDGVQYMLVNRFMYGTYEVQPYLSYNLEFNKTVTLSPGDEIAVYGSFMSFHDSDAPFSIKEWQTIFDITQL